MNGHAMRANRPCADEWQKEKQSDSWRAISDVAIQRYARQGECIVELPSFKTFSGDQSVVGAGAPTGEFSQLQTDFFAKLRSSLEKTLTTGCSTKFDWEGNGRGESVWRRALVVAEFGRGGEVVSALAIICDITMQKQMEQRLRVLARRQVAQLEEERRRIANELHDELGQLLIALRMSLMLSAKTAAEENPTLYERTCGEVALVDAIIEAMRDVSQSLRPMMLGLGLISALQWLTARFSANTGIRCTLQSSCSDVRIPEEQRIAIFRIAQESLTNAARHGKADQIDVVFTFEGNTSQLEVRDNGLGFDTGSTTKKGTLGLTGMQERAAGAGGKVVVWSRAGCGTVVRASFPARDTGYR